MARTWEPDGSNANFWRSDNPLIAAWWRFGDTPAPSWMTTGASTPFLSGMMVDTGPQKAHLIPFYLTSDSNTIFPVQGIAPWATGGSGIQFRWNNATTTDRRASLAVPLARDHAQPIVTFGGTNAWTTGRFSKGVDMMSGITIIGWVQIPDFVPNSTRVAKILGRGGNASSPALRSRVNWQQTNIGGPYTISFTHQNQTALNPGNLTAQTLSFSSSSSPHFPRDRNTPFFFAIQVRNSDDPANRPVGWYGASGCMYFYLGNQASGIFTSQSRTLTQTSSTSVFSEAVFEGNTQSNWPNAFGFAGDSAEITGLIASQAYLPSGSIIDEVVVVNNGYISADRIAHYALSGMQYISTSDPESTQFAPEYPATDSLVAYWTFDQQNGNNSAPETANIPGLYFSTSGTGRTSFVSGIRGGSALQTRTSTEITGAVADGRVFLNQNIVGGIASQSGLSYLFPSGVGMDEGMTWIGWIRSPSYATKSSNGFYVGWIGLSGRSTAFGHGININGVGLTFNSVISGIPGNNDTNSALGRVDIEKRSFRSTYAHGLLANASLTGGVRDWQGHWGALYGQNPSGSTLSTTDNRIYDIGDDDWHLWACVFDLKAGTQYLVKDAKFVFPMNQCAPSGFATDGLGPSEGIFTLTTNYNTSNVFAQFDDWAVYKKVLTLPEMSGFALQGIRRPAPDPYLSTPLVSLVGYWPLSSITTYGGNSRIDDSSWYRHHLTNISGSFSTASALNLEDSSVSTCLQVNVSGSMLSIPYNEHGPNLDMSSGDNWDISGMCAGAWLYVPSGDLSTQGNGTSGLYGEHMIMGAWDQDIDQCSWFMGIKDNKFHIKIRTLDETFLTYQTYELTSSATVPFNEPFFVSCNIIPSGYAQLGYDIAYGIEMHYATEDDIENVTYVISNNTQWTNIGERINSCSASGFSLLNVPNLRWGFPSGTKINNAFVHLGHLSSGQLIATKRSGIENITLGSGSVSSNDPACISHWRMDNYNLPSEDTGPEQNKLTLINNDNTGLQLVRGYHNSGIYLRTNDCLDTLAYNSQARRLDLGSGTQSWTFLGWIFTPAEAVSQDRKFIMNKAGNDGVNNSGIQIFMPESALALTADASGITVGANNGLMSTASWNHVAIVYNRTDNKFINIVNGRYAGLTQLRSLGEIPVNASGMALGGRGADGGIPLDQVGVAGGGFSGILDDIMIFGRALTLPEISGLAANSYSFNERPNVPVTGYVGGFISGIESKIVSGLLGSFLHGLNQDIAYVGGYVNAVSGMIDHAGGYIYGVGQIPGLVGAFTHGIDMVSGIYAGFLHGLGIASGVIGVYTLGAGQENAEFDITFNFQIIDAKDFDSRLEVVKSAYQNFDASLGVFIITTPPECLMQTPTVGLVASGTPYTLTVQGSGWAYDDKSLSKVRFTFADFKGAATGQFVSGLANSGLYQASRTFDTPGWYTVKMEVVDSYGYRGSHCRPFLLVPSGSTSGAYLATLPYISISGTPADGITIHRAFFTHALSGLSNTSGVLEYTDFADQQESLLNSTEVASGTQFINFVRTHDYTMPGTYAAVWAVSGSWGIVSDSLSANTDYGI